MWGVHISSNISVVGNDDSDALYLRNKQPSWRRCYPSWFYGAAIQGCIMSLPNEVSATFTLQGWREGGSHRRVHGFGQVWRAEQGGHLPS